MSNYSPKSMFFLHDDEYNDGQMIGRNWGEDGEITRKVYYQTIILTSEETTNLKKFLVGVKQLDVRVGMATNGVGPYFVQFIGFASDREGNYESDFYYPNMIGLTPICDGKKEGE